jgi:hypothetical protein
MKITLPLAGALGLSLMLNGRAGAQPPQLPEPLYAEGFERGPGTWQAVGAGAKVSVEVAPENVKEGQNSLDFNYAVEPGRINLIVNPISPPALATLQSIRFWVKVNHNASLAFTVQEQNGGRFNAVFSVAKDEWQRVEIAPADLVLQVGKDDPKDANGKLDTDKIQGLALVDFTQFFAQIAANTNDPLMKMLGVETGPRTLYLDDLVLSSKPFETAAPDDSLLDNFDSPQANWFGIGNMTLKAVQDPKQENNALHVDYNQAAGHLSVFAKLLAPGILVDKTDVSFNVASKRHITMVVQLEEKSGGKYNTVVDVRGDGAPSLKTLPFANFKAADDSKDDDNKLDLDSVKQILFIDASGLLGAETGQNTLWLNQIRLK